MAEAEVHLHDRKSDADQVYKDFDREILGLPPEKAAQTDTVIPIDDGIPGDDENQPPVIAEDPVLEDTEEEGEDITELETAAETKPDIDYSQEFDIPMPDGRESVSLGELKDNWIDRTREQEGNTQKADELMVMRRELQNVMQAAGQNVTPEARQRIAEYEQNTLVREHQAMLAARPEWRDANTFQIAKDAMFETARRKGFTDNELKQISDSRVIALLDSLARYEAREKQAVKAARPVRKAARSNRGHRAPPRAKGLTDKQISAIGKRGTAGQKDDAIKQLLGGKL